jgi:hexosaminidase
MNIIPRPLHVEHGLEHFLLTTDTLITYSSAESYPVAVQLRSSVECQLGIVLRLQEGDTQQAPSLHMRLAPAIEEIRGLPFCDEGYLLSVSDRGVVLAATTAQGLLHGIQSLRMMLPAQAPQAPPVAVQVPGVRVIDAPRFRWRGLMLDTARHFFGVPFLLRVLDLMQLYKLNRLHWHLCDDQVSR